MSYNISRRVPMPFPETVASVKKALAAEGFGVLTEIDVQATLQAKLGVEFGPYLILGVCNPTFAHQALQIEKNIGLFMPCNIIAYATGEAETVVAAVRPTVAMQTVGNPALGTVASGVETKLEKIIASLY
ncbi:MAG: DUF302 domain-containing protein [Candidatus Magasanikbacteria bacterium]|nr:DUF302 domain-containing protein [Candidatus Magasanikbacteria bacterium]